MSYHDPVSLLYDFIKLVLFYRKYLKFSVHGGMHLDQCLRYIHVIVLNYVVI